MCVCDRDISCVTSDHIAVTAAFLFFFFFSSFCTLTYPVVYYVVVDHSAYFLTSAQTHETELKLWLIVLCVLRASLITYNTNNLTATICQVNNQLTIIINLQV